MLKPILIISLFILCVVSSSGCLRESYNDDTQYFLNNTVMMNHYGTDFKADTETLMFTFYKTGNYSLKIRYQRGIDFGSNVVTSSEVVHIIVSNQTYTFRDDTIREYHVEVKEL